MQCSWQQKLEFLSQEIFTSIESAQERLETDRQKINLEAQNYGQLQLDIANNTGKDDRCTHQF
jgi:hypothetical protein